MTRIGPAGWSYQDWKGIVYPDHRPRGFAPLAFLSEFFDTIEINVCFYRPLPAATATAWVKQVSQRPNFRFTAKLWRGFTHDRNATMSDVVTVSAGLHVLLDADRLGAVLLQFPWSFRNSPENLGYLWTLQERFRDFPLILEVRHASWSEPGILSLLGDRGIGLCNIDQPIFQSSVKPAAVSTSMIGYVRLHGRNYKSWFTENTYQGERYDYLYSLEELDPWIDRIRTVSASAEDTYVITNNHYLGKAVVNAVEISAILKGHPVPAPPALVTHYQELIPFTNVGKQPEQLKLL